MSKFSLSLITLLFFLSSSVVWGQTDTKVDLNESNVQEGYKFGFKTKWVKDKYVGIDFELSNCVGSYLNPFSNVQWTQCKGSYTFLNGDKYVGDFKNGESHGQGTYTFANGDKYVGDYKNGSYNGKGTFTYVVGHKYVGDFKNGKITGQGTYTYPNGNKYVGGFKNSLSEGFGSFTFANGKKYIGEWKKNKLNGYAIKYYADGRIYQKGIFKDGVFVE